MHCRIDVVTTWRNDVVNLSYLGIIQYYVAASHMRPVITLSPWSAWEPTTIGAMCTRTVRQCTDEVRDQYEKSSVHYRSRVVARFLNRLKISKALSDNIRDMAICYENSQQRATSLRLSYHMWRVFNSLHVVAKLVTVWQGLKRSIITCISD